MNWQDFWANFASTVLGIILGIPAAMWLERLVERRASNSAAKERQDRQRSAVRLLCANLEINIFALEELARALTDGEVPLTSHLESSTWETLRNDLRDLPDRDLLGGLAMLFTRVDDLQRLRVLFEQQFFTAAHGLPGREARQAAIKNVIVPVARDVAAKADGMRTALLRFE